MMNSRRRFLGRIAGGSIGFAFMPGTAIIDRTALPIHRPPRPPAQPDETYWRQVKAQFALRDDYLPVNAANLCPAPRAVIDAVGTAMRAIEGDVSFQNRARFEAIREEVRSGLAEYFNVTADEIAIVRNTSEGNNTIVGGVPLTAGDEVLLFDQNHPTNNVAWDVRAARDGFTVKRVTVEGTPDSAASIVAAFREAITPRTRVLSFSDVSNSTGIRMPARELCALASARGIHAHVDGAQTWGALVRDLRQLGCDSYAASAHKWFMGPKEAGVLYVRAERIASIQPNIVGVGWGNTPETTATGARKFETLGQRNDAVLAALATALEFHRLIGPTTIETRLLELAQALKQGIARLPGANIVTPMGEDLSAGVVIARFDGADARALFERLYQEHRIAAAPTGGLRLSPHVYVTMADVNRILESVGATLRA